MVYHIALNSYRRAKMEIITALNEKLSPSLAPETLNEVLGIIKTAIDENVSQIKDKNKKFLFYTKRKLQEDAENYGKYVEGEMTKKADEYAKYAVEEKEKELNEKAEEYGKYVLDEMTNRAEKYAEYVKEELSKQSEAYAEYVQTESYKDAEKYIVESFVKYVDGIKDDIEKEVKSKMAVINEKKDADATRLVKEIKALIGYKESVVKPVSVSAIGSSGKVDELTRRNHVLESKLKEYETKINTMTKNDEKAALMNKVDEEVSKLPVSKRADARKRLSTVSNEKELMEQTKVIKNEMAKETVKPINESQTVKREEPKPAVVAPKQSFITEQMKRLAGI